MLFFEKRGFYKKGHANIYFLNIRKLNKSKLISLAAYLDCASLYQLFRDARDAKHNPQSAK